MPSLAGLCRACYSSSARSRWRFGGLRDEVLERDGRSCRACGAGQRLHVHHRQPGVNDRDLLVTVCARCHARLHHFRTLRVWVPDPLPVLWAEQHPGAPLQLQFPEAV